MKMTVDRDIWFVDIRKFKFDYLYVIYAVKVLGKSN